MNLFEDSSAFRISLDIIKNSTFHRAQVEADTCLRLRFSRGFEAVNNTHQTKFDNIGTMLSV